jgi:hypothetical protein
MKPEEGNFYCQNKSGHIDFSIADWNKLNNLDIKQNEKECKEQCFECIAIVGQTRLKNMKPEGNTGVEKEPTDEEIERSFNEAADQLISNAPVKARYVRIEKYEQAIASLKELIPIAERLFRFYPVSSPIGEYFKSAIERAKLLRDGK